MKYYDALVRKEEEEAQQRRQQVYEKVPRIKEIEDEISTQSKEISKIIISDRADRKQALEEIRGRLDSLNMEKEMCIRDSINSKIRLVLDEATDAWGIKINRVEVKNINPPKDIQMAMEKQKMCIRDSHSLVQLYKMLLQDQKDLPL